MIQMLFNILLVILIFSMGFLTVQVIDEANEIRGLQITIKENPCFLQNKFNSTIPGVNIITPGPTPTKNS